MFNLFATPSTRAGTMNVKSLSVGVSCDGSDFVVLPPQTQSAPTRPATPSPAEYTAVSSSSSFYDEDDDISTSDEDSGSEYSPSEDLDESDAPFLRYTRGCRAPVTWAQAQKIRQLHFRSWNEMRDRLSSTIPHVNYQGGSPDFSRQQTPRPTVPQTPAVQAGDDSLDEIYSGYHHITTLDLDEVANLSDLKSPTQDHGQHNPDASVQPETEPKSDLPFVQPNFIDPYGIPPGSFMEHLPVCNVPLDSEEYPFAFYTLANSGLNFLTDYDVVESPRKGVFEISAILRRNALWDGQSGMRETIAVGQVLDWPTTLAKVRTREPLFVPFSYTNVWQPRTELARATGDDLPVSPKAMPPMSPSFGVLFEA